MSSTKPESGRLIIASNRLPVSISKRQGKVTIQPSPGGLATALRGLRLKKEVVFFGWPGYIPETSSDKKYIQTKLREEHNCFPLFYRAEMWTDTTTAFPTGPSGRCSIISLLIAHLKRPSGRHTGVSTRSSSRLLSRNPQKMIPSGFTTTI